MAAGADVAAGALVGLSARGAVDAGRPGADGAAEGAGMAAPPHPVSNMANNGKIEMMCFLFMAVLLY